MVIARELFRFDMFIFFRGGGRSEVFSGGFFLWGGSLGLGGGVAVPAAYGMLKLFLKVFILIS